MITFEEAGVDEQARNKIIDELRNAFVKVYVDNGIIPPPPPQPDVENNPCGLAIFIFHHYANKTTPGICLEIQALGDVYLDRIVKWAIERLNQRPIQPSPNYIR